MICTSPIASLVDDGYCLDYYFDTPIDELKFVVTWGGVEVINTVGSCTGTKGSNPNFCGSVVACDGS